MSLGSKFKQVRVTLTCLGVEPSNKRVRNEVLSLDRAGPALDILVRTVAHGILHIRKRTILKTTVTAWHRLMTQTFQPYEGFVARIKLHRFWPGKNATTGLTVTIEAASSPMVAYLIRTLSVWLNIGEI